ncbi:MAG TPA: alpha/beta fold hydrolase [Gemmatimonadota bacterium]|jgi:pimeloyl-ACP methyl ester carboxylesterase
MRKGWKSLLAGAAAFAVPAAMNARITASTRRLESVLEGEKKYYPWDQGYIFYTVRGEGPPLVLVHGVYPGASSFEWRRNFVPLTESRRVYALDMLGFGLSDRPRIPYDPALFEALLGDFLQDVVGEPAAIAATSLSAAFAVHTAFQRPSTVAQLVLIGPTGLYDWADAPGAGNFLLHRALRFPVLGLSGYYGLTSRAGLERYLTNRLYYHPVSVTQEVLDAHHTAAHQAGAAYAQAAFLSGLLSEPVDGVFGDVRAPILLVWGRHSKLAAVDNAGGFASLNPRADLEIFEASGALPHVEEAERFNALVAGWLAGSVQPSSTAE